MNGKTLPGVEIYPRLIKEIKKSQREILVVSNWFDNDNLFEILLEKQKNGIRIKLVLEKSSDFDKVKYAELIKAGGEIYRIDIKDFGLMHKRYCLIDEQVAIFMLANWSPFVFAKSHESLIVTSHLKTIQNLTEHFYLVKGKAASYGRKKAVYSVFVMINKWVLKSFKTVVWRRGNKKNAADENGKKSGKNISFKMIKPSRLLNDKSKSTFFHQN